MHVLVHLHVLDTANRGNLLPRLADSAVMLDHERLDVYQASIQFLALSDAMRALELTQTERHDHAKALLVRVVCMLTRMCR